MWRFYLESNSVGEDNKFRIDSPIYIDFFKHLSFSL